MQGKLNFNTLRAAMVRLGYRFFHQGDYNLNLVGIRTADNAANTFNDYFCVLFYTNGKPHLFVFDATTDPGLYWREHPMNVDGTAVVKPGQYPGLWKVGQHKDYEALQQVKPVTAWRDSDRDIYVDPAVGSEQIGLFGINCHRASAHHKSLQVDKWSAGCQVLADPGSFRLLMAFCNKGAERWGNSFTYTLLEENQL